MTKKSKTTTENEVDLLLEDEIDGFQQENTPSSFEATEEDSGTRLDHFLVARMADVSRSRVQELIDEEKITVNGHPSKASLKLKGTEHIEVTGKIEREPLRAIPEDIPLDIVFEDRDLAVINKPAGMMVHAGAGDSDSARNRGTLVNALLFRFNKLSEVGGELRPGIVHRLDRDTSGLIIVAKNDSAHAKLADQFSSRKVRKRYVALVHGWPANDADTIKAPISRDRKNPMRMSTQGYGGREAVSHYKVLERIQSDYGHLAMVEVKIDTGRTHQIRVHMSSIGHPVVGDTLYGAPQVLSPHTLQRERAGNAISLRTEAKKAKARGTENKSKSLSLSRNFLHAAHLNFTHPRNGKTLEFSAPLPTELESFLQHLKP